MRGAKGSGGSKREEAMQRLTRGDVAGAIVLFQELLDGCPDDASAWDDIGWAVKESHPDEAIRYFDRALELDPELVNAWIGRGMAVSSASRDADDAEALRCFERALELDPSCANAWFLKGCVLSFQGRHDEAKRAQERARELDPRRYGK